MPRSRWGKHLRDAPDLVAAFGVAVAVEIGLRVTTLPRLARILGIRLAHDEPESTPGWVSAEQAAPPTVPAWAKRRLKATRRVLRRWPFGDTCLRQALVSGQRLRRLDPTLHVGVAKLDGEVRAHAWIVVGRVVVDPLRAASGYLTLATPHSEPGG